MRSRVHHLLFVVAAVVFQLVAPTVRAQDAPLFHVKSNIRFDYHIYAWNSIAWQDTTVEAESFTLEVDEETTSDRDFVARMNSRITANDGTLTVSTASGLDGWAQYGVDHDIRHDTDVWVYVPAPRWTPFRIVVDRNATLSVSAQGGEDGVSQDANARVVAFYETDDIEVFHGEAAVHPVQDVEVFEGTTGAEIVVDGVTYSYAGWFRLRNAVSTGQSFCAHGCMTAPAHLVAALDGTSRVMVDWGDVATDAPRTDRDVSLGLAPNPFNPRTVVEFQVPAGEPVTVTAFDARGRRVATLHEGTGHGTPQRVHWDAGDFASGTYFVRLVTGDASRVTRATILR